MVVLVGADGRKEMIDKAKPAGFLLYAAPLNRKKTTKARAQLSNARNNNTDRNFNRNCN